MRSVTTYRRALLSLFVGTLILILNSCFTKDPAYTRDNIAGYWMLESYDNTPIELSQTEIFEFSGSRFYHHGFKATNNGGYIWSSDTLRFSVSCCTIDISGDDPVTWEVLDHKDSLLIIRNESLSYNLIKMRRVAPDNESLTGMWEKVSSTGPHPDDFRVEFLENFTYNLYKRNELYNPEGSEYLDAPENPDDPEDPEEQEEWIVDEENSGKYVHYDRFLSMTPQELYSIAFNVNVIEPTEEETDKFLEIVSDDFTIRFVLVVEETEE